MSPDFLTALSQLGHAVEGEPLCLHSTFRLGGPAQYWLAARTVTTLVQAVQLARKYKVPYLILGGGANLLIGDSGFQGLVIQNRTSRIQFPAVEGPLGVSVDVTMDSGFIFPNLVHRLTKHGLSGLEWAVGIPGTVGGAVVNNAGAYDGDMSQSLVRAELLGPGGERVWQPLKWFDYGYRRSCLKGGERNWVILQVELRLTLQPKGEVEQRVADFTARRKATQPPGATIGCMFKNPPGDYAGRLIEAVGLKGHRQGQAQISPVHANFFQNLGGASTEEVRHLIELARSRVAETFGINLELEIEVVGE